MRCSPCAVRTPRCRQRHHGHLAARRGLDRVTYTADFEFKGLGKLVAPLLKPALKKLGDEAETGLRESLAKL